ncbi:SDR family NAD(P)-dependent oxidoreductase [Ferrimonas lipolytica]|uniref:SDR family NAD(P)-dependent oxidoreductase n=1 Tax=Ferrimonas lipolytica TaxID=2724191 RepID=A0A6H1UAH6_9GAMM|nr:SDR family NAD(P)-dependent oxidoreductase [Ferrimonas lipolytica]QIZ75639.1 SDR family NAD(P)-dependent oxidoreductase [Ferrimonas lipolytica]
MYNFDGQVIVITGAGRGLGRTYALAFASRGANVVAIDNGCELDGSGTDPSFIDDLIDLIEDIGVTPDGYCADVTDRQAMQQIIDETYDKYGRIDGLICNAGLMIPQEKSLDSLDLYRLHMEVNHFASVALAQIVLPKMQDAGQGRILFTGGLSSLYGDERLTAFAASCSANMGFVKCMARELESSNIQANVIIPANFSRISSLLSLDYDYEIMTPDLVAPAALWLMSTNAPNGMMATAGGGYYSIAESIEKNGETLDMGNQRPQEVARVLTKVNSGANNKTFVSFKVRMQFVLKQLMLKRS